MAIRFCKIKKNIPFVLKELRSHYITLRYQESDGWLFFNKYIVIHAKYMYSKVRF